MIIQSVLIFGDNYGIPQLLKYLAHEVIVAIVGASIRPNQHNELSSIATNHGLPFFIQPTKKSSDYPVFVENVQALAPELIFVNSYSMMLHSDILEIPNYGAINIHGALLPHYRGCNPIQYALLNNETETGVTMHYMTTRFDDGDIIAQKRTMIAFEDSWIDVQNKIVSRTNEMLKEEIPKILTLTNNRYSQDDSNANYYHRRYPEDGLFQWSDSIINIYNLVRALIKPHPGAFYYKDEIKITINSFLYISELVRLKYESIKKPWHSLLIDLQPISSYDDKIFQKYLVFLNLDKGRKQIWLKLQKNNHVIIFEIHCIQSAQVIGIAKLYEINYQAHTAKILIYIQSPFNSILEYYEETKTVITQFALNELKIEFLSYEQV